jgi:hypothetical protein
MYQIRYLGGQLATIVLLLMFIGGCDKPVDLNFNHQTKYIVLGEVNNLQVFIQIYDVQNSNYLSSDDLSLDIVHSGVTTNLSYQDYTFRSEGYISPGTSYKLILKHGEKVITYEDVLPDTIKQAKLTMKQVGDYSYNPSILLRIDNPDSDYSISWSSTYEPYPYAGERLDYKFIDEVPNIVIERDNDAVGVFRGFCYKPPQYQNSHQFRFKRVKNKVKKYLEYIVNHRSNSNNALFVASQFEGDVIKRDYTFRLASTTQIFTNSVEIQDTSRVRFQVYVYDKNGFPLKQSELENCTIGIGLPNIFKFLILPSSSANPTSITVGNLATITNRHCDSINFNNILNTNLVVGAQVVLANNDLIISDLDTLMISSLNEVDIIKLRLK